MVEAQLFGPGSSEGVSVSFDALTLRFPASNAWSDAVWELSTDTSTRKFPSASVAEISADTRHFHVSIIDGQGIRYGPFLIQSVMCGYPDHTYCFLFHADQEGMWSGHTITKSFGRIVVVPYRTDPS